MLKFADFGFCIGFLIIRLHPGTCGLPEPCGQVQMGSYISTSVHANESSNDAKNRLQCGTSAMQGWRNSQKDVCSALLEFGIDGMLFRIFHGIGGSEVAKYAAKHLGKYIKLSEKYRQGNYEAALQNEFLDFDATFNQRIWLSMECLILFSYVLCLLLVPYALHN